MTAIQTTLLTTAITFLLTGVIGNWLVQRWQQRNWIHQYLLQRAERDFQELQKLATEIMNLGAARCYAARRLLLNINDDQDLNAVRSDYTATVIAWMNRFTSITVQLRIYASGRLDLVLENDIQEEFARIGSELEALVSLRKADQMIPPAKIISLNKDLDFQGNALADFSRTLLDILRRKQKDTYKPLEFNTNTLQMFSTWYLFKALFKPLESLEPIRSSPLDL